MRIGNNSETHFSQFDGDDERRRTIPGYVTATTGVTKRFEPV